ncbi:MAG: PAS domain S-box protein [Syntrophobacteraceae bacterium]|nr:PAS domain S-box protein [Syntrophobacteraceae bacterium]
MKESGKTTPQDAPSPWRELELELEELRSERKHLHESLKHYRHLYEAAPFGYLTLDETGCIREANSTVALALGVEKSWLIGQALAEHLEAADREKFHSHLCEAFNNGQRQICDVRILGTEAGKRWARLDSLPVQDPSGRKVCRTAMIDISPLREEEEVLRESEVTYRSLFENMQEGVAVYRAVDDGEDFLFVDFNKAAEKITRTRKEDLLGKSVAEVFPGVREHGLFDAFVNVHGTGQPERSPLTSYSDDRFCMWYESSIFKLPSGDIVAVFSDQSERKQAEDALRASREKYRTLVETMNEGLAAIDENGAFSFVNDKFCEMVGYSRHELMGQDGAMVLEQRDQDVARRQWGARRNAIEAPYEIALTRKDGGRIQVLVAPRAVFDGRREYAGSIGVFTDITDLKHLEDELRHAKATLEEEVRRQTADLERANGQLSREIAERKRSEETVRRSEIQYRKLSQEFGALLNAIGDTLILLSPSLEVLWANQGAACQLDGSVGDAVGRHCHDLFHDCSEPCGECPVLTAFQSGREESLVARGGGRFLDKRAFPILDGEAVSSVILLISDITEKMTMQAEAMHSAHLASLGELAAGVAHEINNPINGIINYAQVLMNECGSGSLENDIGARILKEGERIADIVKSLLSFTREGGDDKWPTRLDEVLRETLLLTQAQIRTDSIRLSLRVAEDLPEVSANFQQIQQVFLNIVNNARYALNERYPRGHEGKTIEILGEMAMIDGLEYVRIVFVDQGIGIPADKLSMLTKPFFSTKPMGKGTGLGLSITHRIVADHGGRLRFESREGDFTRVTVELPVREHRNGQHSGHR